MALFIYGCLHTLAEAAAMGGQRGSAARPGSPCARGPRCGGLVSLPGCVTASFSIWKFDDNPCPVPNAASRAPESTVDTGAEPLTCLGAPGRFSW